MSQHRTAAEAVAAYDNGEILRTIEMGGISPSYEQCIQIGAIELIRKKLGQDVPPADEADDWGNAELTAVNQEQNLGLSGAQAGAIRQLAYRALRDGWDAMVDSAPKDRVIQFSKSWPGKPPCP